MSNDISCLLSDTFTYSLCQTAVDGNGNFVKLEFYLIAENASFKAFY